MTDTTELAALAEKLEQAAINKGITDIEFFELQKLVFQKAMAALKEKDTASAPEANYLVGLIGLTDGDRFKIPAQNALAHLNTACQLGHAGAGIQLYRAHKGVYPYIPEYMRSQAKGVLLLEKLAKNNFPHATYELAQHYLDLIDGYIQNEDEAPEEHYHQAYGYAKDAMDMGYSGGYLLIGTMAFHGFLGLVAQHKPTAYSLFIEGLVKSQLGFLEYNLVGQIHHWLGYCLFSGDGTSMNRIDGITHYQMAADMNCGEAVQWLEENKEFVDHVRAEATSETAIFYDLEAEPEPEPVPDGEKPAAVQAQKDPAKIINPFEQYADMTSGPDRPIVKKTTTH